MRPSREGIRSSEYSFFVSTQTYGRRSLFQVEKYAKLMVDVLKHYDGAGYMLHAFVVMPDHVHVLLSPVEAVEKSMQLIKGGFSFRTKRELGWNGEVWQPGFTDHRIRDSEDWERHLEYIRLNPVEARLVEDSVLYEWMGFPSQEFPQGLKPRNAAGFNVRAEARTLHEDSGVAGSQDELFPQGLKPHVYLDPIGTAEAVPFQSSKPSMQSSDEAMIHSRVTRASILKSGSKENNATQK